MREGNPELRPARAVHKAWENYQQGPKKKKKKKKCSPLRVVFVGLHFLMWRAHFLLICSQLQKQGEWEQGYFIYPKQFINQTQGIWDSLWQIKVNSVPFVSIHTYKLFLLKVEEVILMFFGCLQAAHAFLYSFLIPRVTADLRACLGRRVGSMWMARKVRTRLW